MYIRKTLWIIILATSNTVWAQVDTVQMKTEYFSFSGGALYPTSTKIISEGNRNPLEYYRIPGLSIGAEYRRVAKKGFTFLTGLHYQKLPVGFKFTARPEDYNGPSEWKTLFNERLGNLSYGQVYIPLKLGFTVQNSKRRWNPSFLAGVNINHFPSYELQYETTLGNSFQVFEFSLMSPETNSRIGLSYSANIDFSYTLNRGNQFFIGINTNFSQIRAYNGQYVFFFKDGNQAGRYTDNGSYVGIKLGYSILRKAR